MINYQLDHKNYHVNVTVKLALAEAFIVTLGIIDKADGSFQLLADTFKSGYFQELP